MHDPLPPQAAFTPVRAGPMILPAVPTMGAQQYIAPPVFQVWQPVSLSLCVCLFACLSVSVSECQRVK